MAAGIRICLNFNQCRGPLTLADGLEKMFRQAHTAAGVTAKGFSIVRFGDDTANVHSDLTESHCSGGTYLKDRHAALEVHMCHESRDNTDLARKLAEELRRGFDPADYDPELDWIESSWQSRQ